MYVHLYMWTCTHAWSHVRACSQNNSLKGKSTLVCGFGASSPWSADLSFWAMVRQKLWKQGLHNSQEEVKEEERQPLQKHSLGRTCSKEDPP